MNKLFVILTLSLLSGLAQAQTPYWNCGLSFQGESKGVKFIIGRFRTDAVGEIRCVSTEGEEFARPVRVTMGTSFLSPAIGLGYFKLAGAANDIGLNGHPDALLGTYGVAQGQVAIVGGVGAFTAVKQGPERLNLQVSLQLLAGGGLHVGFHRMTIAPL